MICPHCQKEIIITLAAPAEDIQRRWKVKGKMLQRDWDVYGRIRYTDERNLDWLSGRQALLKEIGIDKFKALDLLKQQNVSGE